MPQSPKDFYETVESQLGITTLSLSQEIQNLINYGQVTRNNVANIQKKRDVAAKTWSKTWDSISNYSDAGFERTLVLDLINDKIRGLNDVQDSLNSLQSTV